MKGIQDRGVKDTSSPARILKFPGLKKLSQLISKVLKKKQFDSFMNLFNVTWATSVIMSILMKMRHPVDQEFLPIAWHEYKQSGQQFILIVHTNLQYFG